MFITTQTNVHKVNIKLILKLLRHVSVFFHHLSGSLQVVLAKVMIHWNDQIQYSSVLLW